jgi:hypothetical protein
LTNHHVVDDVIHDVSAAGRDYVRDGFLALSREQEVRCPTLVVEVLVGTEDVTRRRHEGTGPAPNKPKGGKPNLIEPGVGQLKLVALLEQASRRIAKQPPALVRAGSWQSEQLDEHGGQDGVGNVTKFHGIASCQLGGIYVGVSYD